MKKIFTICILLSSVTLFSQTIYYVKTTGDDNKGGSSWDNAFRTLQKALATVSSGQIWVASGTYYPDEGTGLTNNDRTISFNLKNNVAIYGGFNGTEQNLSERNWKTNITTLSGDIDQLSTIEGNSYHVLQSLYVDETAVLDGITITEGYTNINGFKGGGMFNNYSSPTLNNCRFSRNSSFYRGGGMFNNYSSPRLMNCSFYDNTANEGGGMWNDSSSNAIVTNCTFERNSVMYGGGGMGNSLSSPTLINCSFSENIASDGAGIINLHCSPTLRNCNFFRNKAKYYAGGMLNSPSSAILSNCSFIENESYAGAGVYNSPPSSATLTNCIFFGNKSTEGGGMYNSSSSALLINCTFSKNAALNFGGGIFTAYSSLALTNCILWDNGTEIFDFSSSSTKTITYCIIQGGYNGNGNLDKDPLFVDASTGDFHLQSCSPGIDAGNPGAVTITDDLDGSTRIINEKVDIGAYEYQQIWPTYYQDKDGDGYGNNAVSLQACIKPTGFVTDNTDCDDNNVAIHSLVTYYRDADGDGYGNPLITNVVCSLTTPAGYVSIAGDLNDNNASINPGAVEVCGDGIDNNCDGQIDEGCNKKPFLSINDASVYESTGKVVLIVTLSKKTDIDVSVNYVTIEGTARSKASKNSQPDFVASNGTLIIPAGNQSANITIVVRNDNIPEPTEQFTVQLSKPVNASIDKKTGTVIILDGVDPALTTIGNISVDARMRIAKKGETSFSLHALPNPAARQFDVIVDAKSTEPVSITVYDVAGRIIEKITKVIPGQVITMGSNYRTGVYLLEASLRAERRILKVVKL